VCPNTAPDSRDTLPGKRTRLERHNGAGPWPGRVLAERTVMRDQRPLPGALEQFAAPSAGPLSLPGRRSR